jgi:tetratricopeptide (TPR) repeat protein
VGDVRSRKNPQGALEAYESSLCARRYLVTRDERNTLWRRDVTYTLLRVGEMKQGLGDLDGAHDAFAETLEIRRAISGRDRTNTLWQRELVEALDRLSEFERARKRPDVAAAFATEAVAIVDRLKARDLDQRDLARVSAKSQQDRDQALADLRQGGGFGLASAPDLNALAQREEAQFDSLIGLHSDAGACWAGLMASLGVAPRADEATATAH